MAFRSLPQTRQAGSTDSASNDPYAPLQNAPSDRPFVIAQLGQSLDGRIATSTGESQWINCDGALDHVHRLRALVDAVVVGVGTAVADNPLLNVRRVEGRSPARVVIDPWGRLPPDSHCLRDDGVRRLLVRSVDVDVPAGCEAIKINARDRKVSPKEIVASLFERGLRRILIEGGSRTISEFIDADALDRLHVLVAPIIIGSGKAGLSLNPVGKLSEARRPRTHVHMLPGGDVLFDCEMRSPS